MTTLQEAAQMALDALDSDNPDIQLRAATHLRAALAQPPCATGSQCVGNKCERCVVQEREWQGLTDKEIENCFEMSMFGTCRAIEAKLKEKNT